MKKLAIVLVTVATAISAVAVPNARAEDGQIAAGVAGGLLGGLLLGGALAPRPHYYYAPGPVYVEPAPVYDEPRYRCYWTRVKLIGTITGAFGAGLVSGFAIEARIIANDGQRGALFGLLWPLTIAESHARAAAVLVNEFDAGHFARSSLARSAKFFATAVAGGYLLAPAQGQSVEINFRRACTHDIGDDPATTAGLGPAIGSLPYIKQQIL